MRIPWVSGLLVATTLSLPASAQLSVYIGSPPPPLRYEEPGPVPGPGFVWIDGYWTPDGNHYRWVHGRWDHAPYAGAYWSHPHYDRYQDGWHLHEGHWDHDDHGDHHDDHR